MYVTTVEFADLQSFESRLNSITGIYVAASLEGCACINPHMGILTCGEANEATTYILPYAR